MRVGLISGSGAYAWPALVGPRPRQVATKHGAVELTLGTVDGVEVVHLCRHDAGHARLSNHVAHKANLAALLECGVDFVVSLTVCGALDPAIALGSLIVFDDLYFPSNRLPDGSLCTWHDTHGAARRGHWIFATPFSDPLRQALVAGARRVGAAVVEGGCYGHVDGPRFNSRAEIAALRSAGVIAVSQTAGPEVVLAGEAELPVALLGYVTDHANGVAAPQSVAGLVRLMRASTDTFTRVVSAALPRLTANPPPAGVVHRFEP
jgi:5'-methylthioadenosine phosphorylase